MGNKLSYRADEGRLWGTYPTGPVSAAWYFSLSGGDTVNTSRGGCCYARQYFGWNIEMKNLTLLIALQLFPVHETW